MISKFKAQIYPTSLSDETLKLIIADLYLFVKDKGGEEYKNEMTLLYNHINFKMFYDIVSLIEVELMLTTHPFFTKIYDIINNIFKHIEKKTYNGVTATIRYNWRKVSIRNYYLFLQAAIDDYDSESERRKAISMHIFKVWGYIDFDEFYLRLDPFEIFNEIEIIEIYHIEQLL